MGHMPPFQTLNLKTCIRMSRDWRSGKIKKISRD